MIVKGDVPSIKWCPLRIESNPDDHRALLPQALLGLGLVELATHLVQEPALSWSQIEPGPEVEPPEVPLVSIPWLGAAQFLKAVMCIGAIHSKKANLTHATSKLFESVMLKASTGHQACSAYLGVRMLPSATWISSWGCNRLQTVSWMHSGQSCKTQVADI